MRHRWVASTRHFLLIDYENLMSEAHNILQAALDNEHPFMLITQGQNGFIFRMTGNLDTEGDRALAEAEFLYRHARLALQSAEVQESSLGLFRPLSMRSLANALNACIAAYEEADDKRDCINPDAPVVIRVEGPRLDGYDEDLYWHVQSCGGADAGMDDDEACHDGMELGIMPIGRDFHSNGRRRKKGWLRSVPASSAA